MAATTEADNNEAEEILSFLLFHIAYNTNALPHNTSTFIYHLTLSAATVTELWDTHYYVNYAHYKNIRIKSIQIKGTKCVNENVLQMFTLMYLTHTFISSKVCHDEIKITE